MIDVQPCQLGPIGPITLLGGQPWRRGDCACGTGITGADDATVRDRFAAHLAIPRPPADVLEQDAPTPGDVRAWPEFFIGGPGRRAAGKTRCSHECALTDSCTGCDADEPISTPRALWLRQLAAAEARGALGFAPRGSMCADPLCECRQPRSLADVVKGAE